MLGPIEVIWSGDQVNVGGSRQRKLLAMLVLNANRVVSVEQLVDELWHTPPRSVRQQIHNAVAGLRSALADAAGEVRIHFSRRDPADPLEGPDRGKLLVAMYAWDGNAFPGNEYWLGALSGAQDDPRLLDATRSVLAGLARVTPADVQKAARTYLGDDQSWLLLVKPEAAAK